ncbi:DUF4145 domain-containing protein [Nocardia bhagyanarayanae]|uniref:Uncharacterized protein DUF4145 n=1 Tax=Nocardia bhagyanarayanae TaxID=1215925 RepID=A0A543EW20_9NOCA|nr:DUF4145 domain-containing protein [Nocardia bhagyanarayanae]TQM25744.1 uncharacterized protein DUF4145 [Nocardia bhagyanarayanae]
MTDEVRSFICPRCGDPSSSGIHGTVVENNVENGPPYEYALLQCSHYSCQEPIVQIREDLGGGFEHDQPAIYFPSPRRLSRAVPRELREGFEEARKCFDAKAYTATLVMVRRTLEGTCVHQGASKRQNLARSLRELKDQGKIDGLLAEWADLLRAVGNEGAHFTGNKVSAQDAEDALDFAEALLDHLYVLRARFDEFKGRQEQRKRTTSSEPTTTDSE